MDAVEYVKTLHRLCKSQDSCSGCAGCPLRDKEDGYCSIANISERAEDAVQIVEQWAKDHPIKTRQSELLKMFPNAPFYRGVVSIPPCSIEKEMRGNCLRSDCYECRRTYWLTEVTDND
uniref:Uncharacterized protein n=1 Tax=Ackermannviridae sp. TaxID=2831612 RepID=A0A8S5VKG4_9CAUD|nr:MAG TPA: hypothetical protein [Ackermannviridae sp.]